MLGVQVDPPQPRSIRAAMGEEEVEEGDEP